MALARTSPNLLRILAHAQEVLPRLRSDDYAAEPRRTAQDSIERLVPEAIDKYLALPRAFRETAVLLDGRTAAESTLEQLVIIERELQQTLDETLHQQSLAVLKHAGYLRNRFTKGPAL